MRWVEMDWRDSLLGRVLFYALALVILIPKPWMTEWQKVALDAILIPVAVWMAWPVFKRITTPRS
jgi:hypothetical protein